jgi:hypothetical protein
MKTSVHKRAGFGRHRARLLLSQTLAATCLGGLAGCSATPNAAVSDPSVYTVLHLKAAENLMGGEAGTPESHLIRYFGSKSTSYATDKLRIDDMLDGQQQVATNLQSVQSAVSLGLTAQLLTPGGASALLGNGSSGSSTTGSSTTGSSTANASTGLASALQQLTNMQNASAGATTTPIVDSPFDLLDRASDLYAAYLIKILQLQGDSRIIDPKALVDSINDAEMAGYKAFNASHAALGMLPPTSLNSAGGSVTPSSNASTTAMNTSTGRVNTSTANSAYSTPDRLLLLVFQSHIDPGTDPDRMVGVRVHLQGPQGSTGSMVRVLRVRPTRSYDVSVNTTDDSIAKALSVSGQVSAPLKIGNLGGNAKSDFAQSVEARQRYLSHISKSTSYADATTQTFGWNFYPSNLKLSRPNLGESLLGFFGGEPKDFVVHAYLEGGARDCEAVVLVPHELKTITCEVWSVWANIDPEAAPWDRNVHELKSGGTFEVELPDYSEAEKSSATRGVDLLYANQLARSYNISNTSITPAGH